MDEEKYDQAVIATYARIAKLSKDERLERPQTYAWIEPNWSRIRCGEAYYCMNDYIAVAIFEEEMEKIMKEVSEEEDSESEAEGEGDDEECDTDHKMGDQNCPDGEHSCVNSNCMYYYTNYCQVSR